MRFIEVELLPRSRFLPCHSRQVPPGWAEVDGALEREFRFRDFAEALAFVDRVAALAEAENHHPDVFIHWDTVKLRWWTHAKNAITERDHELAARSEELV
jgi:4a-hydroxytetrahydrobiopterin dehydratase